jgi:hypothetical protein
MPVNMRSSLFDTVLYPKLFTTAEIIQVSDNLYTIFALVLSVEVTPSRSIESIKIKE